jgi:hypothetical protein
MRAPSYLGIADKTKSKGNKQIGVEDFVHAQACSWDKRPRAKG